MTNMTSLNTTPPLTSWWLIGTFVVASMFTGAAVATDESCVVNISQPTVDYGRTTREQLFENSPNSNQALLGKRSLTLTSVCDAKVQQVLTFQGEAADESRFRFGQQGTFSLRVINAQLDGKPVRMVASGAASNAANGTSTLLRLGNGLIPFDGPAAAAGERLTVQVEVETYVDADATRARSEESWEGGGSFNIAPLN